MFGLREKRDTLADKDMEKGESEVSDRTRGIRERANRRRTNIR